MDNPIAYNESLCRVLGIAKSEAGRMGDKSVGTDHVLLGIILDRRNVAVRILSSRGVDTDLMRAEIESLPSRGDVEFPV